MSTQQSKKLDKLSKALVKFQGLVKQPVFDSTNQFLKTRYASMRSVMEAIRGPMTECGLSLIQFPGQLDGEFVYVATRIQHESGQFIQHAGGIVCAEQDGKYAGKITTQSVGKAITYLRRYGAACAFGLVGQEDDDGEADGKYAAGHRQEKSAAKSKADPNEPTTQYREFAMWLEGYSKSAGEGVWPIKPGEHLASPIWKWIDGKLDENKLSRSDMMYKWNPAQFSTLRNRLEVEASERRLKASPTANGETTSTKKSAKVRGSEEKPVAKPEPEPAAKKPSSGTKKRV